MLNDYESPTYRMALSIIEMDPPGRVLELGTRRWGDQPTHHRALFPESTEYVMSDFMDGLDVDVVSDAHNLREFGTQSFDAVFTASTFEHIEYPWVAAKAIARVLKPGGWVFCQTHQTFPVHGYPEDFTRWTDKGLAALFRSAGLVIESATHYEPATIVPRPDYPVWDPHAPAYLGVACLAYKR